MKKQNWILEASFSQTPLSVMHEQRVTVVDRHWTHSEWTAVSDRCGQALDTQRVDTQ